MPDANDMNELAAEVARRARDTAYVAVGLGVLGLQRVRTARNDLVRQDRVDESVARLRSGVVSGSQQLGEWIEGSRSFVTSQLAPYSSQLPAPARELADRALTLLSELGAQLRQLAPGA